MRGDGILLWSRHGVACTLSSLLHVVVDGIFAKIDGAVGGCIATWPRLLRLLRPRVSVQKISDPRSRFLDSSSGFLTLRCSPSSLVRPAVTPHHNRPIPAILGRIKHTPLAATRLCTPLSSAGHRIAKRPHLP